MQYIIILLVGVVSLIFALSEPWLLPSVSFAAVYMVNVLIALALVFTIVMLIERLKGAKQEKEIIALTAHQLSEPLSSMKWSLEMLLNGDFGAINDEQKTVVKKAYEKNDQLIYLVDDLLNSSRIEEKKYLLERKLYSIEDIVSSVAEFCKQEIEKKKIKLNFAKPAEPLPKSIMDGQKIRLAVQNLFENAIKYTPPGGEVAVSLRKRGKYLEFKIQDSGIGIKKNQTTKIFNKFFRGSNASKQEPVGHGLGLFFVKNIISAHHGKIWFESKEDQGTTFHFILPISKK